MCRHFQVVSQMENLFDFSPSEILYVSAKNGTNVSSVLEAIIERVPCPQVKLGSPFRARIFDSWFEPYRGPAVCVSVLDGAVVKGQRIRTYHSNCEYEVLEVGIMHPEMRECLYAGQVGYLLTTMKHVQDATVGETLYDLSIERHNLQALPLFRPNASCIYASLYPMDVSEYSILRESVHKLALNDSYNGERIIRLLDASHFPKYPSDIDHFLEPVIKLTILIPNQYAPEVDKLCTEARGERVDWSAMDTESSMQQWKLPFAEVCGDFFERLKRITSGYATYNYQPDGYERAEIDLLVIQINDRPVDEFSQIVPLRVMKERAKLIVRKLREEIPRQQFEVRIKATMGQSKKTIAETVIAPMKKDFTGRLKGNFGEQKAGKERMKQIGRVQIPKEAFVNVLRI
ncbi:unnamed protein product [Gongylonema pulchrum]|uniref:Elongation factor 4 homolog n=1 Tax=Gongylonema pulchrum TaxID=637853 RepID=A0A183DRV9_9BILA|nr:unnamed protein product [Gongylonema pulchrum]